jgi:hypothetical protein
MGRYLTEFLSLRCSPDVLGSVGYLGSKPEKEITEAWAIIRKLRKITLRYPNKFQLVDLCSGNALVPVIAAHLLPLTHTYAVDKLPRDRNWHRTNDFTYLQRDIRDIPKVLFNKPTIITSVHSCSTLAETVIQMFNMTPTIQYMFLMPCCVGQLNSSILQFIRKEANRDLAWVTKLAMQCDGNLKISRDRWVLSPKNYILSTSKKEN